MIEFPTFETVITKIQRHMMHQVKYTIAECVCLHKGTSPTPEPLPMHRGKSVIVCKTCKKKQAERKKRRELRESERVRGEDRAIHGYGWNDEGKWKNECNNKIKIIRKTTFIYLNRMNIVWCGLSVDFHKMRVGKVGS